MAVKFILSHILFGKSLSAIRRCGHPGQNKPNALEKVETSQKPMLKVTDAGVENVGNGQTSLNLASRASLSLFWGVYLLSHGKEAAFSLLCLQGVDAGGQHKFSQ